MLDQLSLLYLPVAFGLGALHALEPGHSKTLIAAYLIGTKGTRRHAVLLGISAAATHSLVVIALAVTALWLGSSVFTERATHWLQISSGIIVILLGSWMLWRRVWPGFQRQPHHHQADPVAFSSRLASGQLQMVDTPDGERMQITLSRPATALGATMALTRVAQAVERLEFNPAGTDGTVFLSTTTPCEPHEFTGILSLTSGTEAESVAFAMKEPEGHDQADHAHLDDEAHARAHAADLPAYVADGLRPSVGQIIAFGAAGGLIPCPASVTVMLLALSVGKTSLGLLSVACFSVGLAVTMVAIGMLVVVGVEKMAGSSRLSWLSGKAPVVSASVVLLSGVVSILLATH